MKKKLLLMMLMLLPVLAQAQQHVTLSPLPQKISWGGKAFSNAQKFYIVGANRADSDAVELLAAKLDISSPAISHHLKLLKDGGIVVSRREGKEVHYSLNDEHVAQIFSITMTHIKECPHEK